MMASYSCFGKLAGRGLFSALGIGMVLSALSPSAKAFTTVNRGTDYVLTPSGGAVIYLQLPGDLTLQRIEFRGLPILTPTATPPDGGYSGMADTVINRLDDVTASGDTTRLEVVGLSLQNVSPVVINNVGFDVFAGLQKYLPVALGGGALSTGSMTIKDEPTTGKTWNSSFDINGVAVFAPVGTLTPTGTDYVKGLISGCGTAAYTCEKFTKGPFKAIDEPWTSVRTSQLDGPNLVAPGLESNFFMTYETVRHDAGNGTIHNVRSVPAPLPILGASGVIASIGRLKKLSFKLRSLKASKSALG